jgi:2-oxoglutarate dehydrogenase E1 component
MSEQKSYQALKSSSSLGGDASYVEYLYESYLLDPESVEPHWQKYFEEMKNGETQIPRIPVQKKFLHLAQEKAYSGALPVNTDIEQERKQVAVLALIDAYRRNGHMRAQLDPLEQKERPQQRDLDLAYHGLTEADLDSAFATPFYNGFKQAKLRDIIKLLEHTYCESIGSEYMHIAEPEEISWLQERLEKMDITQDLTPEMRKRVYTQLTAAEGLERYLHTKFVGQKRFSLEGGESLIPMLDEIILRAGELGVQESVIGMAHRGRLNVLVNILGKSPKELFEEFQGKFAVELSSGDVKYHQGFSSDIKTEKGFMHLALAFNPSHLEIVTPVIEGSVRARQERRQDEKRDQVLPIAIHGDAAFAGQGVVMETFNMSQARGFATGGTLHIVINNQVGFTTSNPLDARSTLYCTDIAKMVQAPIFHVNGDDPDAVYFITKVATDYRMRFNKDVVIDLVCYRRHGHNEADEPAATQPMMYKKVRARKTTRELYAEKLVELGVMTADEAKQLVDTYRTRLDAGENIVTHLVDDAPQEFAVDWKKFSDIDFKNPVNTTISEQEFAELGNAIATVPDDFSMQKQVAKIYQDRKKMAAGELPMDWGFAENLAYATLLKQNYKVRICGQDSGRGTFAHRHAVVHNQEEAGTFQPLKEIKPGHFKIIDSLLSEEAVLAFEYGYSTTEPRSLVIWEAQFGDFANGAQVVMDQFISSGEAKWGRYCGLVMLLPHGFEGMGPEHSSARLERYLQLCAEQNMQVCVPSTPAQTFHMLRRQMLQSFRKPLVVMTPKSLLRHKLAVSTKEELTEGGFQLIIPEIDQQNIKDIKRIVLCSGKVYYELLQKRREQKLDNVAIIRIEQLYPFPEAELRSLLEQYPQAKDVIWCQEEPKNQGAWYCSQHHLIAALSPQQTLSYAGREASASPAVGLPSLHMKQQTALVDQALGVVTEQSEEK